jgi:hypothetical protein
MRGATSLDCTPYSSAWSLRFWEGEVAVERRILEHQSDVASHVVALGDHVVAGDPRLAARRLGQRAQHVDRGRLAGAVGAQEAEHLTRRHLEVHPAHRPDLAKRLDEVADGDRGWHGSIAGGSHLPLQR